MSFENINYFDVMNENEWVESRLYDIFIGRLFQENEQKETYLKKAFFWTMPYKDLQIAEEYWRNIHDNVISNHIAPDFFYKASSHKKFHVRPKAQNAADVALNPHGGTVKKYCYWFNREYIKEIVDNS